MPLSAEPARKFDAATLRAVHPGLTDETAETAIGVLTDLQAIADRISAAPHGFARTRALASIDQLKSETPRIFAAKARS